MLTLWVAHREQRFDSDRVGARGGMRRRVSQRWIRTCSGLTRTQSSVLVVATTAILEVPISSARGVRRRTSWPQSHTRGTRGESTWASCIDWTRLRLARSWDSTWSCR